MFSQSHFIFTPYHTTKHKFLETHTRFVFPTDSRTKRFIVRVSDGGGGSYLDMWKKAMDRERKEIEFNKIAENVVGEEINGEVEDLETESNEFLKMLQVPTKERDRIQRIQVIDRAAPAITVASTLLKEEKTQNQSSGIGNVDDEDDDDDFTVGDSQQVVSGSTSIRTPVPSFWSWVPPSGSDVDDGAASSRSVSQVSPFSSLKFNLVDEERRSFTISFDKLVSQGVREMASSLCS